MAALVGFEPHLLPVALVFAGDADAFAHWAIKTAEQLLQRVFTEGRIAAQLRLDLAPRRVQIGIDQFRRLEADHLHHQKLNLQPTVKIP